MEEVRELAAGLLFPEGPVWMPDDSVLLVEIRRGTLSRVSPGGDVEVVADLGGGPNGAAIGPDAAAYVCNNGGFPWSEVDGVWLPIDLATGSTQLPDFAGGWIDRVDPATGESSVLYRECDGLPFCGPNDIVFDSAGGFWFTDLGKSRPREIDRGALYYAQPDGSSVVQVARNLLTPNGVGLSPGGDRVYVAESVTGRLLVWELEGPGRVRAGAAPRGEVVVATKGHFDSLAVEADGHVVVAAIADGLCVVDPDPGTYEYVTMPDRVTTNVCFSGPDLWTALVTLSGSGKLVAIEWPRPGLRLEY
jgi:gluconolactonase